MIDVVFLLLVFFVLTVRPADMFSRLDVVRPGIAGEPSIPVLQVEARRTGYYVEGRPIPMAELDNSLRHLAQLGSTRPIVILCADDSSHADLVGLLDVCAKHGLRNLALLSRGRD